jgi:broad specificity phosphatase PhoE
METETLISFVRHGQVHNPKDLYYGRLPGFHLSDEGRRQAEAAAEALRDRDIAAVYSSPLVRARQTAEIICSLHPGLTLQFSDLLLDVHSPFDGRPVDEVAARDWNVYTGVGPEYEQPEDVLERVRQFVAEIRRNYSGEHVVAVTHKEPILLMLLFSRGKPLTPEAKRSLPSLGFPQDSPVPGSIFTFVYGTTAGDELLRTEYAQPGAG